MKKVLALILALAMVLSFAACGEKSESGTAAQKVEFKIGGGPSGSTNYVVAAGFASLLNKLYPEKYTATAEITIGTQENIRYTQSGEYLMCLAMLDSVVCAYEGTREYEPADAGKFAQVICGNDTVLHLMTTADSDIETFADIKGKKVGVSNGVMSQFYFPMLLEGYDLKPEDVEVTTLALQDMCDGLADGTFDAIFHVVGIGSAPIADLAVTKGIKFLPIDAEHAQKIHDKNPYWVVNEIPAGTYEQATATPTLSTIITMIASNDCPDDVVYDMVKTIIENPEDVAAIHTIAGTYNKDNALSQILIPLHPGAEKYYKEAGML